MKKFSNSHKLKLKEVLVALLIMLFLLTLIDSSSAVTISLTADKTTFLASGFPDQAFYNGAPVEGDNGSYYFIGLDNTSGYGLQRSLLHFPLDKLSKVGRINSANLTISFNDTASDNGILPVSVYSVGSNAWLSNSATWNSFGNGGIFDPIKYSSADAGLVMISPLTELVRKWTSYDPALKIPNNGLLLKSDNEVLAVEKGFGKSPRLMIDYTPDTTRPTNPSAVSTSHIINRWNVDNTVDIMLSGASDDLSGIDGFSTSWTNNIPNTSLSLNKTLEENQTSFSSPPLASGVWFLNLGTIDNAGNNTIIFSKNILHVGPFKIGPNPNQRLLLKGNTVIHPGKVVKLFGKLMYVSDGQVISGKQVIIKAKVSKIKKKKIKKGKKTITKTIKKWIWKVVARTTMDASGNFAVKLKPKNTTIYIAELGSDALYIAPSSNGVKVTVKKAKKKTKVKKKKK